MMVLSVSPSILIAGGQATISITGGSGGGTVKVKINNGGDLTQYVDIVLDDDGNGSAVWGVPSTGWQTADFSAEGASPVSRPVQQPG